MCTGPAFISGITTFMTSYGSALEAYGQQVRAVRRHNKQLHRNFLMELQIVQRQDSIDHAIYQEQIKARDESEESYFLNKELNQLSASLADASNQLTFKERVQKGLFDMQTNMIKSLQAEGQLAASGVQPGASMGAILDDSMRQLGMAEAIIDESFDSSKTALGITAYQSSMSQNSADQNNWNQINPGPSQQPFSGIQPYRPIYQEKPESPNAFQFIMQALFSAAMSGMMADAGVGGGLGGQGVDAAGALNPPVNPFAAGGGEVLSGGITWPSSSVFGTGTLSGFNPATITDFGGAFSGTATGGLTFNQALSLPTTVSASGWGLTNQPFSQWPTHLQNATAGMAGNRGILGIRANSPVLGGGYVQGQPFSGTHWNISTTGQDLFNTSTSVTPQAQLRARDFTKPAHFVRDGKGIVPKYQNYWDSTQLTNPSGTIEYTGATQGVMDQAILDANNLRGIGSDRGLVSSIIDDASNTFLPAGRVWNPFTGSYTTQNRFPQSYLWRGR